MELMARLGYGRLTHAWKGEASDFTPLLAEQLDQIGAAIGVDLASMGQSEVLTTGGRRIDIVAKSSDGSELVVENQYGRADHDHMTRGLAYAVARRARGLVIVAEEHRDEFRAVAEYLNNLAELDPHRGISVWLVEARAVRIGTSPWAPLFTTVVEPNAFTAIAEQAKQAEGPVSFPGTLVSVQLRTKSSSRRTVRRAVAEGGIPLPPRTQPCRISGSRSVHEQSKDSRGAVFRWPRHGAVWGLPRPE